MSVKIYRCPLCGKSYTSPVAMAQCATKCAETEAKVQKGIEELAKSRALAAKEKEVYAAYEALKTKIQEYNSLGGDKTFTSTLRGATDSSAIKFGDNTYWTSSSEWFDIPKDVNIKFYDNKFKENENKVKASNAKSKSNFEDWLKENIGIDEPTTPKTRYPWGAKTSSTKTKNLEELDKQLDEEIEKLVKEYPVEAALASAILTNLAAIAGLEDE